jgi:hypothetical protein
MQRNLDIESIDDRYAEPPKPVNVRLPAQEKQALEELLKATLKADSERAVWGL